MATVRDLLTRKGEAVISIAPTDTVLRAAQLMNERTFGSLIVLDGDTVAGIVTERDILRRVVAAGLPPDRTPVRDIMSTPVITCVPDTSLEECAEIMTNRRIRHLPVSQGRGLDGMISIGDVLAFQVRDQEATIQYMNNYVFGTR